MKALLSEPLDASSAEFLTHIAEGLEELELVEYTETQVHLSLSGREISQIYRTQLFGDVPANREEVLNRLFRIKAEEPLKLKKREYLFLKFLSESARQAEEIRGAKNILPALVEKGFISEAEGVLSLTEAGKTILSDYPQDYTDENPDETFLAAGKIEARKALQAKAELFLSLYRQGFTYQEIGDLYELTRERVRQILNETPNFELYPEECEKAKDGHEWRKKPCDIVTSWERSKTSGCPVCAGKINKAQKQKSLTEVYPDLVEKYRDLEKNEADSLDPNELTLGSNRKMHLKCPIDGNAWTVNIAAAVKQQWSKGKAGCRVCHGTIERRDGGWGEALPVSDKFPEQASQFRNFEKNDLNNLKPEEITSGSSKEAWFKYPTDGFEWKAKIVSIGVFWQRGNSGCPACRGFAATDNNSLAAIYPQFVAEFWDFPKNDPLGLQPDTLTCGTNREAWFGCPSDEPNEITDN